MSSELPGVNVEEGWRSMESGSHNLANVHEEAPNKKGEGTSDPLAWLFPCPPQMLVTPGMKVNIYLCHLGVPQTFSSRTSAFCRGYWGRGTPCSRCGACPESHQADVQNVLGHCDWAPGCLVYLVVFCLWTQAEDRRLVPWSDCPYQCCSHCIQLGHCALQHTAEDHKNHQLRAPPTHRGCCTLPL